MPLRCLPPQLAAVINEGARRPRRPSGWWTKLPLRLKQVLNEIRTDLPPGFYRQLPTLEEGAARRGAARELELRTFVAHTDSRFDPATLQRFVLAFQRAEALRISELWAVAHRAPPDPDREPPPARRSRSSRAARARLEADRSRESPAGADRMFPPIHSVPRARRRGADASFAVRLAQRLRDQTRRPRRPPLARRDAWPRAAPPTHDLVRAEHHRQAAANVTVRNVITSLRIMATFDWRDFVEKVSLIDRLFRAESEFGAMDFATRDRYRHAVEDLARGSGRSEIQRGPAGAEPGGQPRRQHRRSRLLPRSRRGARASSTRSATGSHCASA